MEIEEQLRALHHPGNGEVAEADAEEVELAELPEKAQEV